MDLYGFPSPTKKINLFHSGSPRSVPHTQAANMSVPRLLDPRCLLRLADPLGMRRPQRGTSKEGELARKVKGEG